MRIARGDIVVSEGSKVIAVVDDNPAMRQALSALLSSLGYRVELYASAAEFIAAALKTDAQCLLLDVQLGAITGIELARHLVSAGLHFPTIFMTASDDEGFRQDATALGCIDYLHKPFPAKRLIEIISKALNRTVGQI